LGFKPTDVSYSKLDVEGNAPFRESGVYEVQISIVSERPSEDQLKNKTFSSLWSGNFHLRVRNGTFSETLGSSDNPIPESVFLLEPH
jgi:integrin beta 3/collagen type V/XI/XXIV/XXVII alpha